MKESDKIILWFDEIGKNDIARAGGKGANLGEITRAGIPVPPGFVLAASAYRSFMEQSQLNDVIRKLLEDLDPDDSEKLEIEANRIKRLIQESPMPQPISEAIIAAYEKLGKPQVAEERTATAEDLPDASFAGQHSTFLNVQGEREVVAAVQGCWASLFEPRAIFYRVHQRYDHLSVGIAVPVQRMVQSEVSGVMFTVEPVTSDTSKICIEAIYGLGEAIVSGTITPDRYILDKDDLSFIDKKVASQEWRLVRNLHAASYQEANVREMIPEKEQASQKLDDATILALAGLGKQIEAHYGAPQDIEWAKEGGHLYVVQARPITTLQVRSTAAEKMGAPVSPMIDQPSGCLCSGPHPCQRLT